MRTLIRKIPLLSQQFAGYHNSGSRILGSIFLTVIQIWELPFLGFKPLANKAKPKVRFGSFLKPCHFSIVGQCYLAKT
ncbi:hypothetical protein AHMF7605_02000 [Adhaeribacter arboris]|uniref:Uncharacterized protein n=1 Tax=Adhaeribacter arboris TaxID=2072846 RepID=A0A2T2YA40_9BACT|nr:hypothetical protein AHMF7605_02000 [Adhaeribacter arboris]